MPSFDPRDMVPVAEPGQGDFVPVPEPQSHSDFVPVPEPSFNAPSLHGTPVFAPDPSTGTGAERIVGALADIAPPLAQPRTIQEQILSQPSGPTPADIEHAIRVGRAFSEEDVGRSLLGIDPAKVPQGSDFPGGPIVGVPISAGLKTAAGFGQYATSPQGLAEGAVGMTPNPMAPLMQAKWLFDMLQGAFEAGKNVVQAPKKIGEDLAADAIAGAFGVKGGEKTQEDIQAGAENLANASAMALGSLGLAKHGKGEVKKVGPFMEGRELIKLPDGSMARPWDPSFKEQLRKAQESVSSLNETTPPQGGALPAPAIDVEATPVEETLKEGSPEHTALTEKWNAMMERIMRARWTILQNEPVEVQQWFAEHADEVNAGNFYDKLKEARGGAPVSKAPPLPVMTPPSVPHGVAQQQSVDQLGQGMADIEAARLKNKAEVQAFEDQLAERQRTGPAAEIGQGGENIAFNGGSALPAGDTQGFSQNPPYLPSQEIKIAPSEAGSVGQKVQPSKVYNLDDLAKVAADVDKRRFTADENAYLSTLNEATKKQYLAKVNFYKQQKMTAAGQTDMQSVSTQPTAPAAVEPTPPSPPVKEGVVEPDRATGAASEESKIKISAEDWASVRHDLAGAMVDRSLPEDVLDRFDNERKSILRDAQATGDVATANKRIKALKDWVNPLNKEAARKANERKKAQGEPEDNYFTGTVDSNDSVRAFEHGREKAGNSHRSFGLNESGRWRYIPRYNRVDWSDTPTADKMNAVENYLAKKGVYPKKHMSFVGNEVYRDRTPQPEPEAEGPRLVRELNRLRLSPDKEGNYQGEQLVNTLLNKLHPSEAAIYKDAGMVEAFKGKKVKAKEVEDWMREKAPVVKVESYGMEGKGPSEAKQALDKMMHEWLEQQPLEVQRALNGMASSNTPYIEWATRYGGDVRPEFKTPEFIAKAEKYKELKRQVDAEPRDTSPRATSFYSTVSAFDTTKPMPEWTATKGRSNVQRVDVVLPSKAHEFESRSGFGLDSLEHDALSDMSPSERQEALAEAQRANILWPPDNLHENLPNTLGWAMLQYVDGPNGERIAHVTEAQSRWGQERRKGIDNRIKSLMDAGRTREEALQAMREHDTMSVPNHPLLPDYNRLILKAAIEQAKKEGATHIVIPSGETAMMTEGHDLSPSAKGRITGTEQEVLKALKDAGLSAEVKDGGHLNVYNPKTKNHNQFTKKDGYYQFSSSYLPFNIKGAKLVLEQEPGMRLNYDTILPRIAEELTGQKGVGVDLGEHKNAFVDPLKYPIEFPNDRGNQLRSNLIFRNPDGTPKTTVTGLLYPLDRTRKEFTLFGKDRPVQAEPSLEKGAVPQWDKTSASDAEREFGKALNWQPGDTAKDLLQRMSKDEPTFGAYNAQLAEHLAKTFGDELAKTGVSPDSVEGLQGRAAYIPGEVGGEIRMAVGSGRLQPAERLLHESAHAAVDKVLDSPKTDLQRKSIKALEDLRGLSMDSLSPVEREEALLGTATEGLGYYHNNPREFIAGFFNDPAFRNHINSLPDKGEKTMWDTVKDRVKDILGFTPYSQAEMAFNHIMNLGKRENAALRVWDNPYDVSVFDRTEHPVAALLSDDVPPSGGGGGRALPPGRGGATVEGGEPGTPRTPRTVRDMTTAESWKARRYKYVQGYAVPHHAAASETAANALVRYAIGNNAAPEIARSMVTDVMGRQWQNKDFDRLLGAVLVEDRLQAIKKGFLDQAARAERLMGRANATLERQSVLRDYAQEMREKAGRVTTLLNPGEQGRFEQLLRDNQDIKNAIQRHNETIGQMTEGMHRALGGRLAAHGENTGAFVNLIASLGHDDVETSRQMIFGQRRGDPTNPLRKGSIFNKQATGTAPEYELSYRKIAERMVRGNYTEYWKQRYHKAMVDAGLAVVQRPGELRPTTEKGLPLKQNVVEIKGGAPGRVRKLNLWMRPEFMREWNMANKPDSLLGNGVMSLLADAGTDVQLMGPTDLAWHTINMFATIATSQGGGKLPYDLVRKVVPGASVVDALIRIPYKALQVLGQSPEFQGLLDRYNVPQGVKDYLAKSGPDIQRRVADYTAVGGGRGKPFQHGSVITKLGTKLQEDFGYDKLGGALKKVDLPGMITNVSSHVLRTIDTAGRVIRDEMYDELVRRGWAKNDELSRREWHSQMGQYQEGLISKIKQLGRETSAAPFVIAGTTMNRNAVRKLFAGSGFRASNPKAFAKATGIEVASLAMFMLALPAIWNTAMTGSWKGRPGTPFGSLDLGRQPNPDGKHDVFDPLQLLHLRRGQRITGGAALQRGTEEGLGLKKTAGLMLRDIIEGYARPWLGPSPRLAKIAATGRDFSGELMSKNPYDYAENLKAAMGQANPTIAGMLKERSVKGGLTSLGGAIGIKQSRFPAYEERSGNLAGKPVEQVGQEGGLGARRNLAKAMTENRMPMPELLKRDLGEKDYWKRIERLDEVKKRMSPEQRSFLDDNSLTLPEFGTSITQGKVHIPGTLKEKDALIKVVADEYGKVVDRLAATPGFSDLPQNQKEGRMRNLMTVAHKRIQIALRRLMMTGQAAGYSVAPVASP